MRSKKVTRYWCDHCGKGSLSKPSMAKHEEHCTLNPARNCRVCTLINGGHRVGAERMAELVAMMPDPGAYHAQKIAYCQCEACRMPWETLDDGPCTSEQAKLVRLINAALPRLREETEDCPACIMAALRQRGIPVGMVEAFNFSEEMKTVFANKRDDEWPY